MLSFIFLELTLRSVVSDLPRDAGALIVYALIAALGFFIWSGSRGRSSAGRGSASVDEGGRA